MARQIKNYDNSTFNELVERPVDVFYCGKTEMISMSFSNFPDTKCISNEVWKYFLLDIWDKHFLEMDNILDFMRHVIYHTGLLGKFYKVNCILSLDDIYLLLKDRLPNPEACFTTWSNLHKVARLVLEETYKNSTLDISLTLDLHTRTNTACDNSDDNIKFLNTENLPNEHELVLIYHITVRYTRKDQITPASNSNKSHLDSFSNNSDDSKEFNSQPEDAKETKSISCQTQSGSSDVDNWEKYGARPKIKSYSLKNYTNVTSNLKEREINLDTTHDEQYISRTTEMSRTRRIFPTRPRLLEKVECVEKRKAESLRTGDSLAKSIENRKALPIFDNLSLPPYPDPSNSKELYSPMNNNENFNTSSASTPSVLVSPHSPPGATAASVLVSPHSPPGAAAASVLVSPHSSPPLAAAAGGPSTSDLFYPAPFIPITSEDNTLWKNDGAISKSYGNYFCENPKKENLNVMELLERYAKKIKECSQRSSLQFDHHYRDFPDANSLELAENEKRLDTAEANIRALQAPYEALLLSWIRHSDGLPDSTPDNDHISASQHDSTLQLSGGYLENLLRENILRYELRKFFEDNNFPVASCEESVSPVKTETNFPVKEHGNIALLPDFQFDRLSLVDAKRSPEPINASAASDQIIVSSHDDPNHGYLDIENYDENVSFRWENVSDKKVSSSKQGSDPILLQEISAEKSLKNLENENLSLKAKNKEVADKSPGEIDAIYDKRFEELTQNLSQNPSSQKMSENLQPSSTRKNHSTLEKTSEHVEGLQLACSVKTDDQAKLTAEEEMLSNSSDESINIPGIDYELGYESYDECSEVEE